MARRRRAVRHVGWAMVAAWQASMLLWPGAQVVGVSLAFTDAGILWPALAIGVATLTMVTLGMLIGRRIGALAGKRAEIFGGLVLIAVGSATLWEHLK